MTMDPFTESLQVKLFVTTDAVTDSRKIIKNIEKTKGGGGGGYCLDRKL